MAQWVKAFVARPGKLSPIPGTQRVKGPIDFYKLFSDFNTHNKCLVPPNLIIV